MPWLAIFLLMLTVGMIFWEIRISEGAHLGRRFVIWLYDLSASRYDRIKDFGDEWERRFLGEPIAEMLSPLPDARILDVGAGTGRIGRTLLPLSNFSGVLVNVEPSAKMLSHGRKVTACDRMPWVQAFAVPLPFTDNCFDIVASLEVLEFTPDPISTLNELVRVLHPGGWLIVTNRVGWEARWIFGKTFKRERFHTVLEEVGLEDVSVYPWQMDYDLAWARKSFQNWPR
jgi:ubiquinone/menaquinone biosynthesis C-methylase UbiE